MSPQQLVQDAEQKQQSGDLEGAVPEYRQFLKLHPEVAAIHSNLGAALAGLGRYEEALPEYKTALKLSPKLVGPRLNLALVYYKMGKLDVAATELEKVHVEDPENHQAILLLADCYSRMGRDEDVIRILEPAEQKYPDDQAIAYLLGTALIHEKRVDEGQILIDKILHNGLHSAVIEKVAYCKPSAHLRNLERRPHATTDILERSVAPIQKEEFWLQVVRRGVCRIDLRIHVPGYFEKIQPSVICKIHKCFTPAYIALSPSGNPRCNGAVGKVHTAFVVVKHRIFHVEVRYSQRHPTRVQIVSHGKTHIRLLHTILICRHAG